MTFKWATVTAVSPLRIKLDGDTAAIPATPDSLTDPATLVVDDRVRCELSDRRVVIVGRSGGDAGGRFIGEHRAGEWATSPDAAWVLADGAVLNIADYPLLAAHYEATYGTKNHHGGNGSTTFAVPDTRERTYVNQGGSDIFATIGGTTGSKTHAHPLSNAGQARMQFSGSYIYGEQVSAAIFRYNRRGSGTTSSVSGPSASGIGLTGSTDSASDVQPSFVCRYVIRAA